MEDRTQYISPEKADELKAEKKDLKENKIPGLAKRIDEARQMGDLSENAEYHAAREDLAWTQSRVKEIDSILERSTVLGVRKSTGNVTLGSIVTVKVLATKKEREYTIVGAQEADPAAGKISNESPLGSAFFGKSKGDVVSVNLPAGVQEYEIVRVK
ncbi:MAG TPA: transcription elongation factor GreA [Candidatus Magasanikbacteria bacterium]|nr:transcription elongation factor GreA [Candidatus Magasanikbacteria bacterium]